MSINDTQGITGTQTGIKTMFREPIDSLPLSYLEWCKSNQGNSSGGYAEWLLTNPKPKYQIGETVYIEEQIKITNIKAERLQDISEEDCIKEGIVKIVHLGVDMFKLTSSVIAFSDYTDCFHEMIWQPLPYPPKYQWEANPYVFVYEFETVCH